MPKKITPASRLNVILDLDPQVVDYIVALNPHDFERLHNPLMRKFMSPRISLARVAEIVQRPVDELLQHIATLADVEIGEVDAPLLPHSPTNEPVWVTSADPQHVQQLDLLPIDATLNADPFPPISRAVKSLESGDILLIKHMWEPQPLYDVWSKVGGLEWYSEQIGANEWWVWVRKL